MKRFCLTLALIAALVLPSWAYAQKSTPIQARRYGYAYADEAKNLIFISPISKSWGKLVAVDLLGKSERWTFQNADQVTIVYVTIKENIVAGHSLLQIDKVWQIKMAKEE